MGRKTAGIKLVKRKDSPYWQVEGTLFKQRVRESTGTASEEEATLILNDIIHKLKRKHVYGEEDAVSDFNTVAAKHLNESTKASIKEDARYIEQMASYIGAIPMSKIYRGYDERDKPTSLEQFILDRAKDKVTARTINYALTVLNIIGNKAVKRWRGTGGKPLIPFWAGVHLVDQDEANALDLKPKREVGPMSWEEQTILFNELPELNRDMCLFKVNSGCREQEVCQLRWDWFDNSTYPGVWFFALPLDIVKNRDHVDEGRPVVLNDIAKEVIRNQIGNDSEWVFPHPETGQPIRQMNCTAYQTARVRATRKIPSIKMTNIHALKHTYGARLKAAGVSKDDRRDLLGHKSGDVTDLYCAKELTSMLENTNKVTQEKGKLILWKRAV